MSKSDDLSKLFSRCGGHPETYREIVREDAAEEAQQRWPLLAALRVDRNAVVPPVQALGIGMPAAPAAAQPVTGPATAPVQAPRQTVAPQSVATTPSQALQRSAWLNAPAAAAAPGHAGATPLAQVFARLEGQAAPAAQPEHTPARRSFLDRLKRS